MIPQKVKDHIEEYISQEVYVQIAIIKGKEKISTESAIDKYFNTNHFRDFSEGKPYFHFIDGLRDKCLGKLKNSPMRDKETAVSLSLIGEFLSFPRHLSLNPSMK